MSSSYCSHVMSTSKLQIKPSYCEAILKFLVQINNIRNLPIPRAFIYLQLDSCTDLVVIILGICILEKKYFSK